MEPVAALSLGNAAITALALVMTVYELWLARRGRRGGEHRIVATACFMAAVYASLMLVHYNVGPEHARLLSRLETVPLVVVVHCTPLFAREVSQRPLLFGRRAVYLSALVTLALIPTPWLIGDAIALREFLFLDHPFPRRVETPLSIALEVYAIAIVASSVRHVIRHEGERGENRIIVVGAVIWASLTTLDAILGALGAPLPLSLFEYGFCFFAAALVARDVKLYMFALEASERDFRRLIEKAPEGIAILRDGQVVYANYAMQLAVGGSVLFGMDFISLVHEEDAEAVGALIADAGAKSEWTMARVERPGDEHLQLELATMPTEFEDRPAVVVIARDVTARNELTARVMAMDRVVTMGTLAAGVGHEINNPLAYVLLNLEEARNQLAGTAPGDALANVKHAIDGAERIAHTVKGLGLFSRPDASTKRLRVAEIIESAVAMTANEVKHRAELRLELDRDLWVQANETRLGQVFVNLLINAAHAIPLGDKCKHHVTVRLHRDGETALAEIEDTGEGIPPEARRHIFDPFFTTKGSGHGTGLGLGISKSTIEQAGGQLTLVRSDVGKGTVFGVALPVCEEGPASARVPPSEHEPRPRRSRILLVDDEPQLLRSLARALKAHADVQLASNAHEALELLDGAGTLDLVVSDLMMPNGSGIDLYQGIAERQPELLERIVFITGGVFTPEVVAFREEVDNVFMAKPIDIEALVQHLARVTDTPSAPGANAQ